MEVVGRLARISPRPRVSGVVSSLVRVAVTARPIHREALLDALYVYRRQAPGGFYESPHAGVRSYGSRPILESAADPGGVQVDGRAAVAPGR
jgi:hypothetical protein